MTAVVTIQGIAIVLPHVHLVTHVSQQLNLFQFGVLTMYKTTWFSYPTPETAEKARSEFVQALVIYWGGAEYSQVSSCCRAPLIVVGSNDGRNYYRCARCGASCDPSLTATPEASKSKP